MIDERFCKLGTKDKESFTRIVNHLLRVNFINRDIYAVREKEMKINYNYRFVDRNFLLFEDYLALGGWSLLKDDRFGVIYVTSQFEYNRKRLNKFTTLILLTLRLIYDEERENLTIKKEVSLTVHDLVQKMISLGIISKKPSFKDLHAALSELACFHIVDRMDGNWREPETRFLIYPTILFILSNAKINELSDLIEIDSGDNGDGEYPDFDEMRQEQDEEVEADETV